MKGDIGKQKYTKFSEYAHLYDYMTLKQRNVSDGKEAYKLSLTKMS